MKVHIAAMEFTADQVGLGEKRSCFDASAGNLEDGGAGVLKNLTFRCDFACGKAKISPKNAKKYQTESQLENAASRKKRLTFTAKYGIRNVSFVAGVTGGKSSRRDHDFWRNEANFVRYFNDATLKRSQGKAKSRAGWAFGKTHHAGI